MYSNKMHKILNENKLGIELCENGKSYSEIDESKVINYNSETMLPYFFVIVILTKKYVINNKKIYYQQQKTSL